MSKMRRIFIMVAMVTMLAWATSAQHDDYNLKVAHDRRDFVLGQADRILSLYDYEDFYLSDWQVGQGGGDAEACDKADYMNNSYKCPILMVSHDGFNEFFVLDCTLD